jgi:3-oxoadipate enol-lactonase
MAEAIAGARLVELAGAGHIANVEAPGAFNAALDAFLRDVNALVVASSAAAPA